MLTTFAANLSINACIYPYLYIFRFFLFLQVFHFYRRTGVIYVSAVFGLL